MKTIFVSYRREDTSGHAGRLSDRLRSHFREARVFMDVDTIQPGVDFVQVIEEAVASCDVLLALIGQEWLTSRDALGNRRLDNPEDFIRVEVAAALKRSIPVIPVLLEDARMPTAGDLPPDLARLARINGLDISDKRWEYDVGRLVTTLEGLRPSAEPIVHEDLPPLAQAPAPQLAAQVAPIPAGGTARKRPRVARPIKVAALAAAVCVTAVLAFLVLAGGNDEPKTTITAGAVAPPAFDASGRQVVYEPEQAIDADLATAWRVEGDGRGVTLSLDLGKRVSLRRVGLLPGYAKIDPVDHTNRFFQNRRVARVRYRFDGGVSVEQALADQPFIQSMEVRVTTRHVIIEILETIPGDPNFDYTAISEIQLDRQP
ncbi:MAG: NADase-type glycan-binding domain-containing protein [Acidimicrobiales bacterium]